MLKSWLYRTLAAAIELNKPTITEKLWKKHTEAPGTLIDMFTEISRGENDFWRRQDEKQLEVLREKLRIKREPNRDSQKTPKSKTDKPNPNPAPQSDPAPITESTTDLSTQSASPPKEDPPTPLTKPPKKRSKRIGEPNPVRRLVG